MIITKTPLRISFVGGGSDIVRKNQKIPGSVISTTIDKFIYVIVKKRKDNHIRLSYSKTENVKKIKNLKHPIIKACLNYFKIKNSIEIITIADIPSKGSGLGSSSALTVGVLNALSLFVKKKFSKQELAKKAYEIESKVLKKKLGYQDHFSAVYGGLNYFKFYKNHKISNLKIKISKSDLNKFRNYLILFATNKFRLADTILKKVAKEQNGQLLDQISMLTKSFFEAFIKKRYKNCGEIIDKNWYLKKKLDNSVSSKVIDQIYFISKASGAIGGKILGAGGGGYFMVFAEKKNHKKIKKNLKKFKIFNFSFYDSGSKVIYQNN